MKIKSIEIDNYAPFDQCKILFNDGAYVVVGENNTDAQVSSNGAGKSCLIQAIVWALFGEVIRPGLLVDDIIGPLRKHVRVVLEFEKDGRDWVIDRARHYPGRRNNEPIVKIDGEDVSQHKGNDDFIQQQLGFNFAVFMFAGYSDSENPPFCRLSPSVMLKNFLEVLQLEKIDQAESELKGVQAQVAEELKRIERNKFRTRDNINSTTTQISKLKERILKLDSTKADKVAALESEQGKLEDEVDIIEESLNDLSRYEQILDVINKELEKYQAKEAQIKSLRQQLLKLEENRKDLLNKTTKIKSQLDAKKKEWSNLAENDSCICGYCGSKFNKADNMTKMSALMTDMENLGGFITRYEAEATIKQLEIDPKNKEIKQLEEQLSENKTLHADKQEVSLLIRDLKNSNKRKADLLSRIKTIDKEIEDVKNNDNQFEIDLLKSNEELLVEYHEILARLESEEVEQLQRKDFLTSFGARIKDLKKIVLNEFLLSLESAINANLTLMDTDIRCQIEFSDKKLKLLFTNASKDGEYKSYFIFSRGERSKIDKACSIALNEVFNIGLYIDDEGLSGVDWEAAKGLLDFLIDTDSTRLLVFHNERVQSSLEGRGVGKLIITKNDGVSHVRSQSF